MKFKSLAIIVFAVFGLYLCFRANSADLHLRLLVHRGRAILQLRDTSAVQQQ